MAQFTDSRLANMAAQAIHDAFNQYTTQFKFYTRRAKELFEARDWHGGQQNARARLDLYRRVVDDLEKSIRHTVGGPVAEYGRVGRRQSGLFRVNYGAG
jgi:isocitrate dehydrogenase kinase/phosphatase